MNHQKINNQKHTANTTLISTVALGTASHHVVQQAAYQQAHPQASPVASQGDHHETATTGQTTKSGQPTKTAEQTTKASQTSSSKTKPAVHQTHDALAPKTEGTSNHTTVMQPQNHDQMTTTDHEQATGTVTTTSHETSSRTTSDDVDRPGTMANEHQRATSMPTAVSTTANTPVQAKSGQAPVSLNHSQVLTLDLGNVVILRHQNHGNVVLPQMTTEQSTPYIKATSANAGTSHQGDSSANSVASQGQHVLPTTSQREQASGWLAAMMAGLCGLFGWDYKHKHI